MIYSRLLSQKEIRICEYWAGWLPSLCFLYFNCRMWCCCCYYCYYHYDNVLSWWLLKVAMIHTGTMYQYYFFHRDAGRHIFKILNAAIPTGSTDSRTMLHVNVNSIKNVTKKTGMGEVDFSLSNYYIKDWQECLLLLTCKKSTAYQCNIYPSHRQRNGPNNLSMTFQSFIQYFFWEICIWYFPTGSFPCQHCALQPDRPIHIPLIHQPGQWNSGPPRTCPSAHLGHAILFITFP